VREREPKPGIRELRHRRNQCHVEMSAVRDPALGCETVEVADELWLSRREARQPDPDVPGPPLVLPHLPEQVRRDFAVALGHGAGGVLPGMRQRGGRIHERRQQRLGRPVALVALVQERGRRLEVRGLERANVDLALL
jgi:hypothetical protein